MPSTAVCQSAINAASRLAAESLVAIAGASSRVAEVACDGVPGTEAVPARAASRRGAINDDETRFGIGIEARNRRSSWWPSWSEQGGVFLFIDPLGENRIGSVCDRYTRLRENRPTAWPRAEIYFNTQYIYAHSEYTPQQTMRGKTALYGYLHALGEQEAGANPPTAIQPRAPKVAAHSPVRLGIGGLSVELPQAGVYKIRVLDVSGRESWSRTIPVGGMTESGWMRDAPGLRLVEIHGEGFKASRKLMN